MKPAIVVNDGIGHFFDAPLDDVGAAVIRFKNVRDFDLHVPWRPPLIKNHMLMGAKRRNMPVFFIAEPQVQMTKLDRANGGGNSVADLLLLTIDSTDA